MQPASMLGVGPVQGIRANPSFTNNPQVGASVGLIRGVDQHQASQLLHQQSLFDKTGPNQSKMDEFLEQMLSLPTWPEMGGNRAPWEFNAGGSTVGTSTDTGSGLLGSQKLFTMSLMPSSIIGSSGSQGLSSQAREIQDNISHPQAEEDAHYCFEDQLMATRFQHQRGIQEEFGGSAGASTAVQPHLDGRNRRFLHGSQEAVQNSLRTMSEGTTSKGTRALQLNTGNSIVGSPSGSQVLAAVAGSSQGGQGLSRSPVGSSGSEGSGALQPMQDSQSPSPITPTWHQPYTAGVLPHPVGGGQAKAETFLPREGTANDGQFVKRPRDDDVRAGPQDSMFTSFGGTKVAQAQTVRATSQQSHQQATQGISVTAYGSHTGLAQPQGAAAVVAGTARPRVRARRGQATDPHSIAERLRRERIAERMKALQELVPNSNKTDKASMLDEIIEYVKFLQLQVKVLSMSRLGGAGAVAPLVADLPAEGHNNLPTSSLGRNVGASSSTQDGMAATERQVARLMEEDMGSAMQYLQGKGLCLMPISLATAISTTNPRLQSNAQGGIHCVTASGERSLVDALTSSAMASSANNVVSGMIVSSAITSSDVISSDSTIKGSNGGTRNSKEGIQVTLDKANRAGAGLPPSTTKSGVKSNEDSARRG